MNFDIIYLIFVLLIACIACWVVKKYFYKPISHIGEFCISMISVLLIVFLIRGFIGQVFWIPSGSLEPTLMPGDFVLINQLSYSINVPIIKKTLYQYNHPKTGEIIVFRWPVNPNVDFIKRVIGIPGDKISYINKVLYINGTVAKLSHPRKTVKLGPDKQEHTVTEYQENLLGVKHKIYVHPDVKSLNFYNLEVPKGAYFVMGDNRDNSDDSRDWGFVRLNTVIGEAAFVAFHYKDKQVNWDRIGKRII